MALNCEELASQELEKLNNIQKLLSALVLVICGQQIYDSLGIQN